MRKKPELVLLDTKQDPAISLMTDRLSHIEIHADNSLRLVAKNPGPDELPFITVPHYAKIQAVRFSDSQTFTFMLVKEYLQAADRQDVEVRVIGGIASL